MDGGVRAATWKGTPVTTIPGLNRKASRSHMAVWFCRKCYHQRRGTTCGTTTVMSAVRLPAGAATASMYGSSGCTSAPYGAPA